MEWISIENREDARGQILASDGKKIYLTYAEWMYKTPNGEIGIPANHGIGAILKWWMPLPELPQQ